jgi:hypothetical protein
MTKLIGLDEWRRYVGRPVQEWSNAALDGRIRYLLQMEGLPVPDELTAEFLATLIDTELEELPGGADAVPG